MARSGEVAVTTSYLTRMVDLASLPSPSLTRIWWTGHLERMDGSRQTKITAEATTGIISPSSFASDIECDFSKTSKASPDSVNWSRRHRITWSLNENDMLEIYVTPAVAREIPEISVGVSLTSWASYSPCCPPISLRFILFFSLNSLSNFPWFYSANKSHDAYTDLIPLYIYNNNGISAGIFHVVVHAWNNGLEREIMTICLPIRFYLLPYYMPATKF